MASEATAAPAPASDDAAAAAAAADPNYYRAYLPPSIRTELEAGAFRSLCTHLRDRSDAVQNIDLMTVSGFCRNCLAKWLVVEARRMSSRLGGPDGGGGEGGGGDVEGIVRALDALGYDEAAEEVYGCGYKEWKKRHAKKASDEQMELYDASKAIHATHDKGLLEVKGDKPERFPAFGEEKREAGTGGGGEGGGLLSDVCCQDVDAGPAAAGAEASAEVCAKPPATNAGTGYVPPPPPRGTTVIRVGILTVSDRAAADGYVTGDLGGPAVEYALKGTAAAMNGTSGEGREVKVEVAERAVVPDDADEIGSKLTEWSESKEEDGRPRCDLVLTTGGTGFAPRDVTPEATSAVLDRESRGLMPWVSAECAARYSQPLASLSRATAGVRGRTVAANLPGNPAGAAQVVEVALPLLVRAVRDVQEN